MTRTRRGAHTGASLFSEESTMQFDLAQIDTKTLAETGVEMPVKSLDGKPLIARNGDPVVISVLGSDSTKYRTLTRAQLRKRMEAMAAGKQGALTEAEMDETERDVIDVLVACTVGWKGVLTTEGEPIPFTEDNVRKLYSAYPVIREQVDEFISKRANFISASSRA
jgi:hypothetical protein